MRSELKALEQLICEATGKDADVDRSVAATLGDLPDEEAQPSYTSSVDSCIHLIETHLPDWHWHIGHGPNGVVPYASLRRGVKRLRVEASACTVPLALLHAAVKALDVQWQEE